jgi:hypothetical protein
MIVSKRQLWNVIQNYVEYYQQERPHQGIGNVIPFSRPEDRIGYGKGKIIRKQRLGGMLSFYIRVRDAEKLPLQEKMA